MSLNNIKKDVLKGFVKTPYGDTPMGLLEATEHCIWKLFMHKIDVFLAEIYTFV